MTTDRDSPPAYGSGTGGWAPGEDEVRDLLVGAGARPEVPVEDLERIRAVAYREWQRTVAEERVRRSRIRTTLPAALAAALVLAAVGAWWFGSRPDAGGTEQIATVAERLGGGWVESDARWGRRQERRELETGAALPLGSVVATATAPVPGRGGEGGGLALRLVGGLSVRLDAGTRVRLASADRLILQAGGVYVDSGGVEGQVPALTVETPLGTVREVGTQFEVRLEPGAGLRVRVREGAVDLTRAARSHRVEAGREVTVGRDGRLDWRAVDRRDAAWEWVQALAPSLEIEGVALSAYLTWVERETGLRLRYEDPALAETARGVVLHGTIEGMSPVESLELVLPGSGLAFRIDGETLIVGR